MSTPDSARPEWNQASSRASVIARNVLIALAGLAVGGIVGLVIAGYADWYSLNLC